MNSQLKWDKCAKAIPTSKFWFVRMVFFLASIIGVIFICIQFSENFCESNMNYTYFEHIRKVSLKSIKNNTDSTVHYTLQIQ